MNLIYLADEQATIAAGKQLAADFSPGSLIYLQGNLGAGKTTLVRGFLQGLGYTGNVKSPTYTIVESYSFADYMVHHFDLYRLGHPEELEYLGFSDYCTPGNYCIIEWPEQGVGYLPEPDITVKLTIPKSGKGRELYYDCGNICTHFPSFP